MAFDIDAHLEAAPLSLKWRIRRKWNLYIAAGIGMLALLLIAGSGTRAGIALAEKPIFSPEGLSLPRPDHIVIAVEENHAYSEIIGRPSAPYINSLAQTGALFTQSYAIEHPSQPNYLDLFSGSNQGVTGDECPLSFSTPNLGEELLNAGLSFAAYSEDLPAPGSQVCYSDVGAYGREHAPWVNFTNVPAANSLPFTYFPTDYSTLPTLSFVIPNLNNDMHDGTIGQGDTWLQDHLGGYEQWARTHNSLFIVTFDEDNDRSGNHIATIFVGQMVVRGQYAVTINHFNVLRTLEDIYDLPYAGASANYQPITNVWAPVATPTATPTSSRTATATPTATRTVTPTVTPTAPGTLTGHVIWQGRPAQPDPLQQLPLTLTLSSGAGTVDYPANTTDARGYFTVSTVSLMPGVYSWWAKGPKYLASGGTTNIGPDAVSQEMGTQRAGDSNDDNVVNIVDFNIVRTSFGKMCGDGGYDDRADFTGDCHVAVTDFNLQRATFGATGSPPPGP